MRVSGLRGFLLPISCLVVGLAASSLLLADPLATSPSWTVVGDQPNARLGSVVVAADVNGDGIGDLVLTAPLHDLVAANGGAAFLYLGSPTGPSSSPAWSVGGDQSDADFGSAAARAGDVNGDGYDDVIIGASNHGTNHRGRAYLYLGTSSGLASTPSWIADGPIAFGPYFGSAVGAAGDVNGDGYDDVLVGAPRFDVDEDITGRAYLYMGSAAGLSPTAAWAGDAGPLTQEFGSSVGAAGDVNGDGFDDVIIGDHRYEGEGAAFVFLGSAAGIVTPPAWTNIAINEVAAFLGPVVANPADVNGDGYSDVIVGAWNQSFFANPYNGLIQVYLGSPQGLSAFPNWTEEGTQSGEHFGDGGVAAEDFNCDGFTDLLIGSIYFNVDGDAELEGRASLYLGSAAGLPSAPSWTVDGGTTQFPTQGFGSAGDINGDGAGEIFASEPFATVTTDREGRVRVFPAQGCLELIDPLCDAEHSCDGRTYLRYAGVTGASLVTDPNILVEARVRRTGTITDGVSTLLIRMHIDEPVLLSLKGPNGLPATSEHGVLTALDGSSPGTSLVVSPKPTARGNVVLAQYRPPATFPTVSGGIGQGVGIAIESTTMVSQVTRSTPLKLMLPPIVLVHGVWSDSEAWRYFRSYALGLDYDICDLCLVNYGATLPAAGFDPHARTFDGQFAVRRLIETTDIALWDRRRKGMAAAQVDLIGHSEGGLIARSRVASQFSPYETLASYNRGSFHKIITVGTPHLGSPLADWLVEHRCDPLRLGDRLLPWDLEDFFAGVLNKPIGAAIFQFQTQSHALEHLQTTAAPCHAMMGIEPSGLYETELLLDLLPKLVGDPLTSVDGLLGGNENHDTVVPTASQIGGWGGTPIQVHNVVHANLAVDNSDTGETESPEVWTDLLALLAAPPDDPYFVPFLPFVRTGEPLPAAPCSAQAPSTAPSSSFAATVSLLPPPGTLLDPNSLNFPITFAVTNGNPIDGAVFVAGDRVQVVYEPGPYELAYNVGRERAGVVLVEVHTFGPGPENYSASTWFVIQASAPPLSIDALPHVLELGAIGDQSPLRVTGRYPGGLELDLTSGGAGTSYAVASMGTSVISVSPDGLVEARGEGQDVVVATNGGRAGSLRVKVKVTNRPPVLSSPVSLWVMEGDAADIPVIAMDPDGDAVSLSAPALPAWASIVDEGTGTGALVLRPTTGTAGSYALLVSAADAGSPALGDFIEIAVTVTACSAPAPVGSVDLTVDAGSLSWAALDTATGYDVTRGALGSLRATAGDFTVATDACLARNLAALTIPIAGNPAPGEGFWYLARGRSCGGSGSFDSGDTEQAGSADAEVDAASVVCPRIGCGNGIKEGTEACDGPDLGGATCQSQGFSSGTLTCTALCDGLDTQGCS
jgi:hypothetical protein